MGKLKFDLIDKESEKEFILFNTCINTDRHTNLSGINIYKLKVDAYIIMKYSVIWCVCYIHE